jgi:hypothetical protein
MVNNDWLQLSQQLHNELNVVKRDILVSYVIATNSDVANERGLYEQLLIDVEMESCGTTSRIEEAIAATQLYFHRYFVNLEAMNNNGNPDNSNSDNRSRLDPETLKQELKNYWTWFKNYRVWEANRKVFLYPENYIRPELRATKTPAFKTLEDDLLQGEVTEEAAQRVYRKYLEEYTEVSRLTIAGGYVYDAIELSSSAKSLVLFGRTKTDPRRYYYRFAKFLSGEKGATTWDPWLKVNVQIDADKVYPVFAFDRVFVFWAKDEIVTATPSTSAITTTESAPKDGTQQTSQTLISNSQPTFNIVKIYYSFYNLTKEWVPPQILDAEIKVQRDTKRDMYSLYQEWLPGQLYTDWISARVSNPTIRATFEAMMKSIPVTAQVALENIGLLVETSDKLNIAGLVDSTHDNIIVHCTYDVVLKAVISQDQKISLDIEGRSQTFTKTFSLTPELYTVVVDLVGQTAFDNSNSAIFQSIFNEDPPIAQNNVVMFNTTQQSLEGSWFSFDYKGGSFLCKPDNAVSLSAEAWPKLLKGNSDGLPPWTKIDAAVQLPDGFTVFFRNDQQKYAIAATLTSGLQYPENNSNIIKDIKTIWGKVNNNIALSGVIDAAYVDRVNHKTYLFSGSQYVAYSHPDQPERFDNLENFNIFDFPFRLNGADNSDHANTYEWVDEGFPQPIATHPQNLCQLSQIDAAFQAKDGKIYFFNNAAKKYYIISGSNYTEKDISADWRVVVNSIFITAATPPRDDPSAPSVDAGFVYNGQTYLLNRISFVKYTDSTYQLIADVPKRNNLFIVLKDLDPGYAAADSAEENRLRQEVVVAAYDQGTTLYFTTKANGIFRNYEYKNRQLSFLPSDRALTAGFAIDNVVYQFFNKQLVVTTDTGNTRPELVNGVNAAFVGTDNQVYIFRQSDYIVLPKAGLTVESLIAAINTWANSRTNITKWGKTLNKIALTGTVDAAFCDGEKTYLFKDDEYLVYSGDAYTIPDAGYPKQISTNTENLPQWNKIDAVLPTLTVRGNKGPIYFFDNRDCTFAQSDNLTQKISTSSHWGRVRNLIEQQGQIDTAFVNAGALFLTRSNQLFRYTLQPANPNAPIAPMLNEFVDLGYPQSLHWDVSQLNGIFTLSDKTYVFSGSRYAHLQMPLDMQTSPMFKAIQGNWGNLPKELKSGFDAALTTTNDLFLFKGDRYIKYANITRPENPRPFDIEDLTYEIVRLTSSTAYRLNQKLFAGGLPELLSLNTQLIDDIPAFSVDSSVPANVAATTIKVQSGKVHSENLPNSSHLDFNSANGIYYWEIFFHAPYLIAQALNQNQKFPEAKTWYEFIYDPTNVTHYWNFLPFLAIDIQAMIHAGREALEQMRGQIDSSSLESQLNPLFNQLAPLTDVFLLTEVNSNFNWKDLTDQLRPIRTTLQAIVDTHPSDRTLDAITQLQELIDIIATLKSRYDLLNTNTAQLETFLNDPFDPHAIAALRRIAYRKAIVMAYIDNLIDWGDMLFQQYTRENINEARMLYILAYDLLGQKPENLGTATLSEAKPYRDLGNPSQDYDLLLTSTTIIPGSPIASVANPYFYIPDNSVFSDYWNRVEDRLYKIRHCLNIMGISQPLPLFQPPIDPMALVQAVSTGASLSSALASLNIPVPHYRFSFMLRKAQDLVQKLSQFGSDLLIALEKQDAEALNLLQNRQEGEILAMTRSIKAAQLEEAQHNRAALEESLAAANNQADHYQGLLTEGLLPTEQAQIGLLISASALQTAGTILKIGASFAYGVPQITIGPFSFGTTTGGEEIANSLDKIGQVLDGSAQALSFVGEVIGIYAQHERSVEDWKLQKAMADSEVKQLTAQIEGAKLQEVMAQREIEILEKQIDQNAAITTYMKEKFSNAQLYQWMSSQLSGLYFQTYQMAFDMAKAAEKAFQFERGMKESEVNFIAGVYWDSQKKGLLAGDRLGVDLDRMEKAYIDTNRRGFEITKNISLLDLDPVALLQLKNKGVCEFSLPEGLFDYDFPGHYCRQIRTLSLTFDIEEGQTVMATLTQLNHKTVLDPDPKAVKYLLDPKDLPPLSIRNGWRATQQIALSAVEQGERNNGLFELRFDDDRYLPFENTGAVSTWRLGLNGKKNSYNINSLQDVIINLKYTAEQGGAAFAAAVKGLLKPYPTARFFDVAQEFPDAWAAFLQDSHNEFALPMSRDLFHNMSSGKITGIFARYDSDEPAAISIVLNGDKNLTLKDGKFLPTPGLSISSRGVVWVLTIQGNKQTLRNINLVLGYQAAVA